MAKRKRVRHSAASKRSAHESRVGILKIACVAVGVAAIGAAYIVVAKGNRALDEETLCPTSPASITVLLVDVTDPMTTAQRQDFRNQLTRLRNSVPRYGKLIVAKVDSAASNLLEPVIVRCNPGTAADVSELTGNPRSVQQAHQEGFIEPLDRAFQTLSAASGADRSPIFESVQSVALTELQPPEVANLPRRLVVVSDLLQNTDNVSFYRGLPDDDALLSSPAFRRVRTDLTDVEVEIWMLERSDAPQTQPRALIDLWDRAIAEQGGVVTRVYNVSG